jgi:hypothetical protein
MKPFVASAMSRNAEFIGSLAGSACTI